MAGTGIGAVYVIAATGTLCDTAVLTVADIHLRINAGSNTYDVDGWERDDDYVDGGEDWINPNSVLTAGSTGAAPADVYKSVRHRSPHTYSFPASKVPDGSYRLRIHFSDAYSDRIMKYTVEDIVILENFDIVSEAGVNTALVKEFDIVVGDGNGMQIMCESPTGDVFEAGIEIIRTGGVPLQPAQLLSPIGGESFEIGQTMTIAWRSNNDALFNDCVVAVSPDDGDGWFIINREGSIDHSSPSWGSLAWTIPATVVIDGANVSLVSSACRFMVYQYNDPNVYDECDDLFTITDGSSVRFGQTVAGRGFSWRVVNGMLMMSGNENRPVRIQLFNMAGVLVTDRTVSDGRMIVDLGIATSPGIHMLRLTGEHGECITRLSILK